MSKTTISAAVALPAGPASSGFPSLLANIATVTGRNLHRLVRVPSLIVFATAQPVMFVLLFTYAFGGVIHPPGVTRYADYLLPGIFVLAIAFGASQTGVAIADDLATGMMDRFRALPMARSAVLAGRTTADGIRNLFVLALMTATGYAIGFRFHADAAAALAAIGLAGAVGVTFSWFKRPDRPARPRRRIRRPGRAADRHPAHLHSSTFVPVATMPGWLQAFARINPITVTVTVDALRALCLGGPTAAPPLACPGLDQRAARRDRTARGQPLPAHHHMTPLSWAARTPAHWTTVDRDYETLRACIRPSSAIWASKRPQQPHRQHFVDRRDASGYVPSGTSPGRNGPFGAVRLMVSDESGTFSAWLMTSRRGTRGC